MRGGQHDVRSNEGPSAVIRSFNIAQDRCPADNCNSGRSNWVIGEDDGSSDDRESGVQAQEIKTGAKRKSYEGLLECFQETFLRSTPFAREPGYAYLRKSFQEAFQSPASMSKRVPPSQDSMTRPKPHFLGCSAIFNAPPIRVLYN